MMSWIAQPLRLVPLDVPAGWAAFTAAYEMCRWRAYSGTPIHPFTAVVRAGECPDRSKAVIAVKFVAIRLQLAKTK